MELKIVSPKYGEFIVLYDDEDHEKVSKYNWFVEKHHTGTFYIRTRIKDGDKRKSIKLHRYIMNFPVDKVIDHINHNNLDNRKCNLRICTNQENQMNKLSSKNSSSKYKGVSWNKENGKWRAEIRKNKKLTFLGYFKIETEAAVAYNNAAKKMFKNFAYLNIV